MSVDNVFLGMRATNDFTVEGQRPKNFRDTILYLYPNGKAPLTALLSMAKSEKTDDPEFNWYAKELPTQAGDVTGVFSDSTLTTDVTAQQAVGATLYLQMSEEHVRQFKPTHTVMIRNDSSVEYDTVGIVEDVVQAGADSYLKFKLLEQSSGIPSSANIQRALIIGSANAEGQLIGQAIAYDPYKLKNYTQIFRNALEITRTAENTYLRTGQAYKEAKREAAELHSIEMEKAFLFGVPSENQGGNGKPLRTTGGLIWATRNHGGMVRSFTGNWTTTGKGWLSETLMEIFRYGDTEKFGFIGDAALLGINNLAENSGTWNFTTQTRSFGINIQQIVTPFGILNVKTHPLFSHEPSNRHSLLIFSPKDIRYRYITDTTFYPDDEKHGHNRYDGRKEEFLTECGLEYHFPKTWAWLNNIGK